MHFNISSNTTQQLVLLQYSIEVHNILRWVGVLSILFKIIDKKTVGGLHFLWQILTPQNIKIIWIDTIYIPLFCKLKILFQSSIIKIPNYIQVKNSITFYCKVLSHPFTTDLDYHKIPCSLKFYVITFQIGHSHMADGQHLMGVFSATSSC